MKKKNFTDLVLVVGVIAGIFLAIFSSIKETNFQIEEDWVARVGDAKISKTKYFLQLEGLALDSKDSLDNKDKAFVLERMIEEELLVQRAKDLGLLSTNTIVRGTIVQQMINLIISENSLVTIKESELQKFYEENKSFFTRADKLRVRQVYFSDKKKDSYKRSLDVYRKLEEGLDLKELIRYGDDSPLQVPDTLMTLAKVREYVGPSLMQIAKGMQPGQFTPPKKVAGGYKIIYLIDRKDALPPDFFLIRDRVKSEYLKRKDDKTLRLYLENLKNWYEIERNLDI
tara:strand:- start:371 stop:1225 length:855 start_codon:yes stop_codon:yes gene_type:complete